MKPTPQYDFPVSVRHQVWEEDPQVAQFYEGIFGVWLNFTATVMFVPQVDRDPWPPVLPDDLDDVSSKMEARRITVALSRYVVTPDPDLASEEEVAPQAADEDPPRRVSFYVTPEEFDAFSKELAALDEEMPAIHDYRRISEIANLEFARFLLSRVITSKHFSRSELHMLGR